MELKKLLEGVEVKKIAGESLKEIGGIAYHTKQIGKGFLFAAIRGLEADGHQFIEEAVRRGAGAVVSEEEREVSDRTLILVPNSRQALAKISSISDRRWEKKNFNNWSCNFNHYCSFLECWTWCCSTTRRTGEWKNKKK